MESTYVRTAHGVIRTWADIISKTGKGIGSMDDKLTYTRGFMDEIIRPRIVKIIKIMEDAQTGSISTGMTAAILEAHMLEFYERCEQYRAAQNLVKDAARAQ